MKRTANKNFDFETFFNLTPDLLSVGDLEGKFIKLSAEWEKTLGYKISEMEGKKFIDFVHPDDKQKTLEASNYSTQKKFLTLLTDSKVRTGHTNGLNGDLITVLPKNLFIHLPGI